MTVQTLLEELRARDIWVWADGNRLQCSTPASVPKSEVSDLLRQRKSEILDFLRGPAELSFAQQRLWFLDQLEPGGAVYVIAGALELDGALDARVLERALGALVNRHEALRTVFVNVEGRPLQVVSEPGAWALPVADLSAEADKDQRLRERLRVHGGPADRPRPPVESHRGAFYSFTLPLELTEALRGLARREDATLFMTLLSGFALLLARYSAQQDLLIGTPVANRNHAEIEELVGFFVNTLVLRADLSGEPSVREFLGRMREVCLDAYAHQDLPFDRLVGELRPARDMSRNPLFQVMFALQNAPRGALELPGLTLRPVEVDRGAAHVDLSLMLQETPAGLSGSFEYATDLFEESTIARMAAHWRSLLEAMSATPERCVSELPLLTEAERHQLLVEWNDTAAEYPAEALLHELFEAQAARTPERPALRVGATALSYAELDSRANRLARALRSRGVSRGQRVGLCVERDADMLAAVLGILKAGAAYVPLDPSFPAERLRVMAEDAQLTLLGSTTGLAGAIGLPRERQLLLDADAKSIAAASDTRLPVDAHTARAEDPAYGTYPSGSTGKPKVVRVPHGAVVNFLTSMAREPGLTADDVLVAVTTLSFDIAVLELQLPLSPGATVVMATGD